MNQPAEQPKKKGMSTCLIIALIVGAISIPVIGVMAALGIYGVRRYLAAAKTAEAKNTIGAISRAAVAAYEREPLSGPPKHELCGSSSAVPAAVPQARKYLPSPAAGADFNTGSATSGWKCLRFMITEPVYYQYQYQKGSGYAVPSIAPGPDGFEAVAHGDLDGNGKVSTFARSGKIEGGVVMVETNLYIDNEFE